ncbi:MAG: tRNA pseudouridine(13) synthase TruD [Methermicoccaceae archaeon]
MARESTYAPERVVGMEVYASEGEGIGGTLKQTCEDFVVRELYEPHTADEGRYLLVEVEKTNWDTHMVAKEIAKRLHVSQRRVGFAGTKDKRARTSQLMSIYGLKWEDVQHIKIRDVQLSFVGYSQRDVHIGQLTGNAFSINLRDVSIEKEECEERISAITQELEALGGAPNFFGQQRFGTVRPITHEVGRLLLDGDVKGAVFCYIAMPFAQEGEEAGLAREKLWKAYGAGEHEEAVRDALREYPLHLKYERAMLDRLLSASYEDALRVLPMNLQKMFVHAFQSYIFNRSLSEKLRTGLALTQPVVGEWVRFEHGRAEQVSEHTLKLAQRLARFGKAKLCLPLVGYDTELDALPEYAKKTVEKERVEPARFRLAHTPELSSKGTLRQVATSLPSKACVNEGRVLFELTLPRGSYATVVLREYTKSI